MEKLLLVSPTGHQCLPAAIIWRSSWGHCAMLSNPAASTIELQAPWGAGVLWQPSGGSSRRPLDSAKEEAIVGHREGMHLLKKTVVYLNTKPSTEIHCQQPGIDLKVLLPRPAVLCTGSLCSGVVWVNSPHLAQAAQETAALSVLGLSLLPQPLCLWALSGPAQPLPHTAHQ